MPIFLVERNFAEKLRLSAESMHQINDITDELGARWLYSFLSADVIVEVSRFWPDAVDIK